MKRLIIGFMLVFAMVTVGCSSGESYKLASSSDIDTYSKYKYPDYANKVGNIKQDTIKNYDIVTNTIDKLGEEIDFDIATNKGEQTTEKLFIEQLSSIKTDNEDINKEQQELLDMSIEIFNSYNDVIKLWENEEKERGGKGDHQLNDSEKEKIDKLFNEAVSIEDYIKKQKDKREKKIEELIECVAYYYEN